jgi:hypothetical protein
MFQQHLHIQRLTLDFIFHAAKANHKSLSSAAALRAPQVDKWEPYFEGTQLIA